MSFLSHSFMIPMKPIPTPLVAGLLLGVSAGLTHADVLYTMAGPQLVDETWNFAPPGLSLSRGSSAAGTLYFKYTVTSPASNNNTESYYAGMSFFEGGNENLGIGNGWNPWAYSAFSGGLPGGNLDLKSGTPEPNATYQQVRGTDVTTMVIRVDFNSGANDNITVWLNPDLALPEAAQNPALTTAFTANANFDTIYLREGGGGGGWKYSDFAIAEKATDSGFFALPTTTSTWDGGGADGNWSSAANWIGDTPPTEGFDLVFPNSASTSPVNDLTPGTAFTGLNFDAGAFSYTLSGNAIGISNQVRNSSANPQTVALPLQLNGPLSFDTLNAPLFIDGAVSGPHGITKTGGNRLELAANNLYTGNTAITAGTLAIGNGGLTGSIDPTGTVSFGVGVDTRLEFFRSDDIVVANPIQTAGRANIAALSDATVDCSGPVSGPGEFWTHGPGTVKITPNAGSAGFTPTVVNVSGVLEVADFTTGTLGTSAFCIAQGGAGTLRYTGSGASTDRVAAYALQGAGTNSVIEVAKPGAELTLTQPLADNAPGKGLAKAGPGTLILAVAQTYSGDTVVEEGELVLKQPGFSDGSTVTVGANGRLRLDFTGSDTVAGVVFGSAPMAAGTYNSTSHPDFISGNGSLVIPSTDPFPAWITAFTFAPGADLSKTGDPDGDGLTNFEEFAFGLAPDAARSIHPIVVPLDKNDGTFRYTRRIPSLTGLAYSVWYSTDLATWAEDTGAVEGTPVVNGEVETVPVTLSAHLLANPKLFIQVHAK